MTSLENFEYFTGSTRNGFLVHCAVSMLYALPYMAAERHLFNPDPHPFIYAFAYTSMNNMRRIFVTRDARWDDNVGVFMGAAAAYSILSNLY